MTARLVIGHRRAEIESGYDLAVGASEVSARQAAHEGAGNKARYQADLAFREKTLQRNREWRARERAQGRSR